MKFQSIVYLFFLTLVWVGFMALKRQASRQVALLLASYLFYSTWGPAFLVILLLSSLFNYYWGGILRYSPTGKRLWAGLLVNVLLLAVFKYLNWALGLLGLPGTTFLTWLAPVGLSFYTFQAMSYLLDIYRETEETEPTLVEFLLYMAFWPIVLAGPICRIGEMIPQFRNLRNPTLDHIATGAQRILFGLFLKVVLADMMGYGISGSDGVDTGFNSLSSGWSGVDVWFLAVGFGFQLYFDFAGYTHMAIGSANLFGIKVRENFNDPYLSQTPAEFWARWHMSLSSWIRDYVFFPLATMRREFWWRNLALIISMTIFGIWHGAGATFLMWGTYHGLALAGHRLIQQARLKRRATDTGEESRIVQSGEAFISWAVTFALISLGWIFFRSNSLGQALTMLRAVLTPSSYLHLSMRLNYYIMVLGMVGGYFLYTGLRALLRPMHESAAFDRIAWLISPLLYSMMIFAIIVWSRQSATFVYLQF